MIKGEKIILRNVRESDVDVLYSLKNNVEERGEFWNLLLLSQPLFKKKFNDTGLWTEDYGCMIIETVEGDIVGEIVYFKTCWYIPGYEVGYQVFKRENRGKGYTSEALKIFSRYLFGAYNIERLEVNVALDNEGSRRVAEKNGFKHEGIKRKVFYCRGKFIDCNSLSLTREDL